MVGQTEEVSKPRIQSLRAVYYDEDGERICWEPVELSAGQCLAAGAEAGRMTVSLEGDGDFVLQTIASDEDGEYFVMVPVSRH